MSLVAIIGFFARAAQSAVAIKVNLTVSLQSKTNITLPLMFMGQAIDSSIITKREWETVDFNNSRLKRAMELISPAYLRFGGIFSDFTTFEGEKPPGFNYEARRKEVRRLVKEAKEKNLSHPDFAPDQFQIFGNDIDRLIQFSETFESRILFCLNSLLRTKDGWNSTNMFQLIDYLISKKFTNIDFGVGNEPLAYKNITGIIVGKAVKELRKKLDNSILSNSKIIAPDLSRLRDFEKKFLTETIQTAGESLSGASFHQYYLDSRRATWQNLIQVKTLNDLRARIQAAKNTTVDAGRPDIPVWLTESGSTFGGGTEGLSRSFISALGYADKLGLSARLGLSLVARQSLFGGRYAMFSIKEDYEPSPEFWICYLFAKLNGRVVRPITVRPNSKTLRRYGYITEDEKRVTLMLINVNADSSYEVQVKNPVLKAAQRLDYYVTTRGDPAMSQEFLVNGQALKLPKTATDNFQPPEGRRQSGQDPLLLSSLTMVFVVYEL